MLDLCRTIFQYRCEWDGCELLDICSFEWKYFQILRALLCSEVKNRLKSKIRLLTIISTFFTILCWSANTKAFDSCISLHWCWRFLFSTLKTKIHTKWAQISSRTLRGTLTMFQGLHNNTAKKKKKVGNNFHLHSRQATQLTWKLRSRDCTEPTKRNVEGNCENLLSTFECCVIALSSSSLPIEERAHSKNPRKLSERARRQARAKRGSWQEKKKKKVGKWKTRKENLLAWLFFFFLDNSNNTISPSSSSFLEGKKRRERHTKNTYTSSWRGGEMAIETRSCIITTTRNRWWLTIGWKVNKCARNSRSDEKILCWILTTWWFGRVFSSREARVERAREQTSRKTHNSHTKSTWHRQLSTFDVLNFFFICAVSSERACCVFVESSQGVENSNPIFPFFPSISAAMESWIFIFMTFSTFPPPLDRRA